MNNLSWVFYQKQFNSFFFDFLLFVLDSYDTISFETDISVEWKQIIIIELMSSYSVPYCLSTEIHFTL